MRIDIEGRGATQFDVVARDGATVLGKLEASLVGDVLPWEGATTVQRFWIGDVRVEPSHRRLGVGRALVQAAKAEGRKRFGAPYVYARIAPYDGVAEEAVRSFHAAMSLQAVGQYDVAGIQATVTRGPTI